jgi:hypothetical protein
MLPYFLIVRLCYQVTVINHDFLFHMLFRTTRAFNPLSCSDILLYTYVSLFTSNDTMLCRYSQRELCPILRECKPLERLFVVQFSNCRIISSYLRRDFRSGVENSCESEARFKPDHSYTEQGNHFKVHRFLLRPPPRTQRGL